ncbi:MAG TPA: ferric reductase-like transmembrane domain-containing protein [Gaiellaceae bacterium]|nr:ferric reductase-like transmembrane domain-containing protein [Gaiellaceae bacterium]
MNTLTTSGAVWYLMRATGVVTLILLTAVFALGIATTTRWRTARLPGFATLNLHRSISLLAVVFLTVHVATAVIDPYAAVGVAAVVFPFVAGKSAFWVGLGALSLDLTLALIVTSLLRRRLSLRVWRAVHWAAYLSWPFALFHALGMGSDTGTLWLRAVAGACVLAVVAAVVQRLRYAGATGKRLEPQPA